AASHRVRRARSWPSQRSAPKCCEKCLPTDARGSHQLRAPDGLHFPYPVAPPRPTAALNREGTFGGNWNGGVRKLPITQRLPRRFDSNPGSHGNNELASILHALRSQLFPICSPSLMFNCSTEAPPLASDLNP